MLEADGVSPHTAHTTNPVPLVAHGRGAELRDGGSLADLAPTVLTLLGQPMPEAMTGTSLVVAAGQRESVTFQQVVNSWCGSRERLYARRALALEQPDLGILRKAQRGDERAFSIIVRAYERPIYNYVLRLVGDRALAEDLTQEVFLRVYQGLPGFSLRSRFTTWLFQVTKNRVLDELRSLERRPRSVVNIDDIAPLESLDAPFERAETIDALWRAVEALNVDLKMALLLRDVVGLSYTEIADSLEITLATVKWRIYKAREEVQAALVRDGVGVATSAAGRRLHDHRVAALESADHASAVRRWQALDGGRRTPATDRHDVPDSRERRIRSRRGAVQLQAVLHRAGRVRRRAHWSAPSASSCSPTRAGRRRSTARSSRRP